MRVADYKELRVYRLAFESAMEIFELSRKWPSEEKFSLIDQIRRSSRSVCANIAAEYFVVAMECDERQEREALERGSVSYGPRSKRAKRSPAPRSPGDTR